MKPDKELDLMQFIKFHIIPDVGMVSIRRLLKILTEKHRELAWRVVSERRVKLVNEVLENGALKKVDFHDMKKLGMA